VCCAAHERKKLERLCRYITRPAIANERLVINRAGQVVLTLKTPYRDGTTHILMSPLEFRQPPLAGTPPRGQNAPDPGPSDRPEHPHPGPADRVIDNPQVHRYSVTYSGGILKLYNLFSLKNQNSGKRNSPVQS
jgi:hypothetical protein